MPIPIIGEGAEARDRSGLAFEISREMRQLAYTRGERQPDIAIASGLHAAVVVAIDTGCSLHQLHASLRALYQAEMDKRGRGPV